MVMSDMGEVVVQLKCIYFGLGMLQVVIAVTGGVIAYTIATVCGDKK